MPPGNADLCRQPRALGANGIFDDLHHERLAFKHLLLNGHQSLHASGHLGRLALGLALPHIGHMQKCGAL